MAGTARSRRAAVDARAVVGVTYISILQSKKMCLNKAEAQRMPGRQVVPSLVGKSGQVEAGRHCRWLAWSGKREA